MKRSVKAHGVHIGLLPMAAACVALGWSGVNLAAMCDPQGDVIENIAEDRPDAPQRGDGAADEIVHHCVADEHGRLSGSPVLLRVDRRASPEAVAGAALTNVVTLVDNGPTANRLDVVFVGDGYTAGQLGLYATHVQNMVNAFFAVPPYNTYAGYFNIHRVDVISAESGVSHDPTYPIWRNTALGMGFWCNGLEHLLCVNVGSAWAYANAAPDWQQIVAVANSTKYGGAGYIDSNVATTSGNNTWTLELMRHEMGHSFAKLADEYGGACHYSGPEPPHSNVSIYNASQMQNFNTKWANWLNHDGGTQFDGLISTYVGAHYCNTGIHRPTNNSKMRTLGRPFNLPSIEAIIIRLYHVVDPIDDASPPGSYGSSDTLTVTPMQPIGHSLDIQWFIDGQAIAGANGTDLMLASLGLDPGEYDVSVSVRDETTFVRNEGARDLYMTSARNWQVMIDAGVPADLNGDGVVDVLDLLILLDSWGACKDCGNCPADFNSDCAVDVLDLLFLLDNWG